MRINPAEYTEIIENNFGISYEAGLITVPHPRQPLIQQLLIKENSFSENRLQAVCFRQVKYVREVAVVLVGRVRLDNHKRHGCQCHLHKLLCLPAFVCGGLWCVDTAESDFLSRPGIKPYSGSSSNLSALTNLDRPERTEPNGIASSL